MWRVSVHASNDRPFCLCNRSFFALIYTAWSQQEAQTEEVQQSFPLFNASLQDTERALVFESAGILYARLSDGRQVPLRASNGFSENNIITNSYIVESPEELDFSIPLTQDTPRMWFFRQGVWSPNNSHLVYSESHFTTGEYNVYVVRDEISTLCFTHEQTANETSGARPLIPVGWLNDETMLFGEFVEIGYFARLWTASLSDCAPVNRSNFDVPASQIVLMPDRESVVLQTASNAFTRQNLITNSAETILLVNHPNATLYGWVSPQDIASVQTLSVGSDLPAAAAPFIFWPTRETRTISRGFSTSHKAVDIRKGSPGQNFAIIASASGTVVTSGPSSAWTPSPADCAAAGGVLNGTAWVTIIEHSTTDGTYRTIYLHLVAGTNALSVGTYVNFGEFIGTAGNTGCASGIHLHFEVRRISGSVQTSVDPYSPSLWIDLNNDGSPDDVPSCPSTPAGVILYDWILCAGNQVNMTSPGLYFLTDYSFNNLTESALVQPGYSVRMYKDASETSASACITGYDGNLNDNAFSDGSAIGSATSLIRVYSNTTCTLNSVPNDEPDGAFVITSLPYTSTQNVTLASKADGVDPGQSCIGIGGSQRFVRSVWYRYTPAINGTVTLETLPGEDQYDTIMTVYTGSPGTFTEIACSDDIAGQSLGLSRISSLSVNAGNTYWIMVTSWTGLVNGLPYNPLNPILRLRVDQLATAVPTATQTASPSPTPTMTPTPSRTPTATLTPSRTPSPTLGSTVAPTASPSPTPTQTAIPGLATIGLVPGNITTSVGTEFITVITVESGSTAINGVGAYIDFDPAVLEVVSIAAGADLSTVLQKSFNNTLGRINYAAGELSGTLPQGSIVVATITFRAKAQASNSPLTFANSAERDTDVQATSGSVLGTSYNGAVTVVTGGTIVGTVGIPRPHPVDVNVRVYAEGQTAPHTNVTLPTTGGAFTLSSVPFGLQRVWVKHAQSLAIAVTHTVVAGNNPLSFTLRLGDADNNNVVNIADFSLLATTFGKGSSTVGFDARADFDGNNVVNIADFSLLATNFGLAGAAP